MSQTYDVTVIGAGLVGTACAYELASSGLRVAIVDPCAIGAASTNLGYGSLSILHEPAPRLALTRYGLELWSRMADWLPADCEYRRCGTIWIALDESSLHNMIQRGKFLSRSGISVEVLDPDQLAEAEPELRTDLAGGLLIQDDACMRGSRAAEFLFQLALQNGVRHIPQRAVSIAAHEVTLEDGSMLYSGNIVNASGAEGAHLTPHLPILHSKGHLLVVDTQPNSIRHHVAEMLPSSTGAPEPVRFEARQNDSGEVWIGSSYQSGSQTMALQVEPRVVAMLLRRAIEMVPIIGQARPNRSWTGLRALTADGLPLIGRLPQTPAIFAACAHDDYGATTALATAKLIADELLSRTPEIDPLPYSPDRFQGNNLKYAE